MAMTGGTSKLVKTGILNYGSANAEVQLYVYYKTSQNETTNKSTITCGMYIIVTGGWNIGSWSDYNGSYIGTTSNTFDGAIGSGTTGTKWLVENKTFTVTHNDDGTGKATIYWKWGVSSPWAQMVNPSGSFTITLPTIARASEITSASDITLGSNFSVKWTPASSSFKYKLKFLLGDWSYTTGFIAPGQTSTYTYTYDSDNYYNNICAELPNASVGTATAILTTYNENETAIGSSSPKTFKITIPNNEMPTLGTISLDPTNITTTDGISRNILVQDNNTILFSVSGCSAGYGSSIKSYKFDVLSDSAIIATKTTANASATFGPFSKSGTLKFRLTVTDGRGRSVSNKDNEPVWTCYAYSPPSFSSFTAYRCDSDGTANDDGTHVKYSFGVNYSVVGDTNNSTVKIFYKKNASGGWVNGANALTNSTIKTASDIIKDSNGSSVTFSLDSTYSVYAVVTDNYKGSIDSPTVTIFSASRIFNIRENGTGIAFGKLAESDNLFESKWPAKFDSGLTLGTSTQSSTPTNGIVVHDVRNADITPNSFGDKNANFYFDTISAAEKWYSILHMKGWNGDYAAWELAGNAGYSLDDNTLKYRQGLGDTWGDWQTVITNKNIDEYVDKGDYLPIDGSKTLTGQLYLGANLWYKDQTSGLNCQNSDITNVNSIYFQDISDYAGEGISFYRGNDVWDTLYAANGNLMFHPNRESNAYLGGSKVHHDGYPGPEYDALVSGVITTGSATFNYGNYRAYIVVGQLTSDVVYSTTYIPAKVIGTSAAKYYIADEVNYYSFTLQYSGSIVTLQHSKRSTDSGKITHVYGVK